MTPASIQEEQNRTPPRATSCRRCDHGAVPTTRLCGVGVTPWRLSGAGVATAGGTLEGEGGDEVSAVPPRGETLVGSPGGEGCGEKPAAGSADRLSRRLVELFFLQAGSFAKPHKLSLLHWAQVPTGPTPTLPPNPCLPCFLSFPLPPQQSRDASVCSLKYGTAM